MDDNHFKDKLLEKTFSIVKNNIDNNKIKNEVFSLNLTEESNRSPDYIKVSINRKEYDEALQMIMDYFIENEWYEECAEIKKYQDKLEQLQNTDNNETATTEASRSKSSTIKE